MNNKLNTHRDNNILPPPLRPEPQYDKYKRYILPDPHDVTKMGCYTRATTMAGKVEDKKNVSVWRERKLAEGLLRLPALSKNNSVKNIKDFLKNIDKGVETLDNYQTKREFNDLLDSFTEDALTASGASSGSEFGTALHAWSEHVDAGLTTVEDVPELYRERIKEYVSTVQALEIEMIPDYIERIVYNPITNTMGTLDRIVRLPDNSLAIADIKTSSNLEFGFLSIATQLAQYAHATKMLSNDYLTYSDMPKIRTDIGIVFSIPKDRKKVTDPLCVVYIIDLQKGLDALFAAVEISNLQKSSRTLGSPVFSSHDVGKKQFVFSSPEYNSTQSNNSTQSDTLDEGVPISIAIPQNTKVTLLNDINKVTLVGELYAGKTNPPLINQELAEVLWTAIEDKVSSQYVTVPEILTEEGSIIFRYLHHCATVEDVQAVYTILRKLPEWRKEDALFTEWAKARAQSLTRFV